MSAEEAAYFLCQKTKRVEDKATPKAIPKLRIVAIIPAAVAKRLGGTEAIIELELGD